MSGGVQFHKPPKSLLILILRYMYMQVRMQDGRQALQLTRATPEEAAAWEEEQRRLRIEAIHEAAGGQSLVFFRKR
jgi:hypothetical protein